jgi:uncharacterized membrane protein
MNMKKTLQRMHIASISLGVIAASGLIYNLLLFTYLYPRVLHFEPLGGQLEALGILSGLSLAVIGFFHLITVMTLVLQVIVSRSAGFLRILTIVIGIISGLLLLSDLAMLQDIGKQYALGWNTAGEWTILFINHGLHVIFTVLALLALLTKRKGENPPEEAALKDEVLFNAAHMTGLLCGGIGLVATVIVLVARIPILVEILSIPVGVLILLPYLLMLGIWLFFKRKEKVREWLDEKQFQDIARAGLWTTILLPPCMIAIGVLQLVNGVDSAWSYTWLPFYIFLAMLVFSSTALASARK